MKREAVCPKTLIATSTPRSIKTSVWQHHRAAPDKNLFTSAGLHITCHPVKPGIKVALRWANAPHTAWKKGFRPSPWLSRSIP